MELNFEYEDYPFNGTQLCNESNSDLFFPEEYIDQNKLIAARDMCNACPLVASCLEYAVSTPWLDGIWAGTTPRQRSRIRSQRNKKVKSGH